ncbi:hypothetical protein FRZ06_09940 [Anoxybacterium hadale]|uniref:Uncharacterized protein n=1 Tax=Anoxybacterium hadale TaxID=3408580 RepID=A0ACD1ABG1_9FIRM|nr:hypothetical protein FRZ06_09940 [Clostridiales bacterium]
MVKKNQETLPIPDIGYLISYEQLNILLEFLRLWSQLAMWTRSLILSTVNDTANKTAIVNHLYTIPTEFYRAFRIFYGTAISQQILNLLTNFITAQWRLIHALKEGNQQLVDELTVTLYQTADEFAEYIAPLNVYWDVNHWKSLLYQYIRLVIDEMVAMMTGEHEKEIEIHRRLDDVAEIIGSYMARGIIARNLALGGQGYQEPVNPGQTAPEPVNQGE